MATIHFVDANNNIGRVYSFSHQVVPWCLVVCDQNGTKHYIPTDGAEYTSYDEDMGSYINRYSYSSSSPSLHAAINSNVATYVINAYNTVSTITKYDVPAGTYTPSAFKSLIEAYMSVGATRTCANSFTVTLNNVTTTIPAGSTIYYSSFISGITARLVGFGDKPSSYSYERQVNRSYTTIYCVERIGSHDYFYNSYTNYPITIGTGIKFN